MEILFEWLNNPAVITSILAPIIGGLGWFLKNALIKRENHKQKEKKEEYINRLRSIASVYSAMERLKDSEEISRVLLLEVSNGGHKPKPGSIMYARAVEVRLDDIDRRTDVLSAYKQVRLDEQYISMCLQIQQTGQAYVIDTDKHSPCILRDFYINEKIHYSEVYHIFTDIKSEKMFILSISTYDDIEKFQRESTRGFINTEVMQIRSYFEEYRK